MERRGLDAVYFKCLLDYFISGIMGGWRSLTFCSSNKVKLLCRGFIPLHLRKDPTEFSQDFESKGSIMTIKITRAFEL